MSNNRQVPTDAKRFFSEDDLYGENGRKREWSDRARQREAPEKSDTFYIASRQEKSIALLHSTEFIEVVLPGIIERLQKGEKVKILDVGGGFGLYAKQLREAFPNQVRVYTTGLKKKFARQALKENALKSHRDDLKWRSVTELHEFEEFDLIIDTFGEAYHGIWGLTSIEKKGDEVIYYNYDLIEGWEAKLKKYLDIVYSKLKPGGRASIAPNIMDSIRDRKSELLKKEQTDETKHKIQKLLTDEKTARKLLDEYQTKIGRLTWNYDYPLTLSKPI